MAAHKARPEWADRLEKLREKLGMSQAALAKRLNVSPMATSRWERGVNQPPASIYVQLGKMAGDPGCWYFWERAGLRKADVQHVLPDGHKRGAALAEVRLVPLANAKLPATKASAPSLIALPLYSATGDTHTGETFIDRESVAELVVAPKAWCPHPAQTICLRNTGDRMASVIPAGAIYAVDEADPEPSALVGKLVLAVNGRQGALVSWLRNQGGELVLSPENRVHQSFTLSSGWKLQGRVLWWYCKAP